MGKIARILMLACLVLLGGCAGLSDLQAPRLAVVNVGMVSADIFNQQFRIRLHVQNPNSRELPVKGIEYELFLQGDSFAEGLSSEPFVVPALGEAEFDTTVQTNFMSSIGRLLSKTNSGSKVQYAFVGKVHLSKGLLRTLPFSESGTVDLALMK